MPLIKIYFDFVLWILSC